LVVYVTLDYWLTDSFVEVHNTGYRSCPTVTLFINKPTSRGMRIETNSHRKSVKSEKIGRQGEEKKSGGCSNTDPVVRPVRVRFVVRTAQRWNAQLNSEHNGETSAIRLHTANGDSKTSSGGHCTWCLHSALHRILDAVAGWHGKPIHSLTTF
jgi:hypothetical protein